MTNQILKENSADEPQKERKVLLVGNFLSRHGVTPQVCETLHNRLRDGGWEVYTSSNKISHFSRIIDISLALIVKKNKYDLVIIDTFSGRGFWFASIAALIASFLGKPYILNLHGGNLPDFLKKNARTFKAIMSHLVHPFPLYGRATLIPYIRVLRKASCLISPSSYLVHEISALGFQVEEIPNSIDIERYTFRLRTKPSPKLLWVRSLHHIYNPILAVEVLAEVKKQYPAAKLTMVGPDKGELVECKRKAHELHVSDSIFFTGLIPKDKINVIAQEHDIFINTTNVDNAPVSVIEAMAMGLPIVSTNVGGMSYLLQDGKEGLLVPPDNVSKMTSAIFTILTDPDLPRVLSESGRRRVEKHSWEYVSVLWGSLYDRVLHRDS